MRGSAWTVVGYGGSQFIRLLSNLLLTRLFLPEIFGIMALVQVAVQGLVMFSDTGIHAAIIQSNHSDRRGFLDTAWTIGVVRGFALWLVACLAAGPIARVYEAPEIAYLLPVVAVTLFISGLQPTKVHTSNRDLYLGRIVSIELSAQIATVLTILLSAIWIRSAWAMVAGSIVGAVMQLALMCCYLDGGLNRICFDRVYAKELLRFGRWVFIASMAGFAISQGDRLLLGLHVTLADLGVYNIGWFLGSVPLALTGALSGRVLLPLYKMLGADPTAKTKAFRTRCALSLALVGAAVLAAYAAPYFVNALYKPIYKQAGVLAMLIAIACIPKVAIGTSEPALLANGNSGLNTILELLYGGLQIGLMATLVPLWGVLGVPLAMFSVPLVCYPVTAWAVGRYRAWLPVHDFAFVVGGVVLSSGAMWVHSEQLFDLLAQSGVRL